MNFLNNKKILSIGLIAVVLIILMIIIGFFYWQKENSPQEQFIPFDVSQETVKAKCLEDVAKMTDDELINKVKILKYPEEIDPITGEKRITTAEKNIINYFICKIKKDKNEDNYNLAKNFISELDIQEKNKQAFLNELETIYLEDQSFSYLLANGNLELICPEVLSNLCLFDNGVFDYETKANLLCNDICDKIERYKKQPEDFIYGAILNQDWQTNVDLLRVQYRWRTAMAYRIQGVSLAETVCEQILINDEKSQCLGYVDLLNKQSCNSIVEDIKRLICY